MGSSRNTQQQIGRTIAGKYLLRGLLGSGGMGDVYEAEHLFTHRLVALKLIHEGAGGANRGAAERVFREAAVAAAIDHPAVVEVFDAGEEPDGALYVVFERLKGEDLESALRRRAISPLKLVRVCARLLDALDSAHALGFVHRDIKPANIFLATRPGRGSRVKLIDFGIARATGDGAAEPAEPNGIIIGTVEYMSPEQAAGDPIDARSDLWAVGAVLFRGLTGRPPFQAESYTQLIVKIATEEAPSIAMFRPELPDDLIALVDGALERDRNVRWQSGLAMAAALRACDPRPLAGLKAPIAQRPDGGAPEETRLLTRAA